MPSAESLATRAHLGSVHAGHGCPRPPKDLFEVAESPIRDSHIAHVACLDELISSFNCPVCNNGRRPPVVNLEQGEGEGHDPERNGANKPSKWPENLGQKST